MPDDHSRSDDPSEVKSAVPTNSMPELPSIPLVVANVATQLVVADPATLTRGLRYLRDYIPGFTQLSPEEQRALTRVASLDPEFMEAGLRTAKAWDEMKTLFGHSGEELGDDADEIRRWDEAESELRATLRGVAAANRKRRHALGRTILLMYSFLGITIDDESRRHLRPHYEEMKRAYLRSRKRKRKPAKEEKPEP